MKIARDTLLFILKVSESTAPLEFAGMLQADGDVITEVIFLPGTTATKKSAVMRLFMLPNINTIGTVHSHPNGNLRPSNTDLVLFSRKGNYHIIVAAPFDLSSWRCYNKKGEVIPLDAVDYEFKDEEFEL